MDQGSGPQAASEIMNSPAFANSMTRQDSIEKVTIRVIEKKNLGAKHCMFSARWDYKQHRFQDFFFRQHRFRNATLGGISNTRSKERSEAL